MAVIHMCLYIKWKAQKMGKRRKQQTMAVVGKKRRKMGKRRKQQTMAVVGKKCRKTGKRRKQQNHGSSGKAEKNLLDEPIHI